MRPNLRVSKIRSVKTPNRISIRRVKKRTKQAHCSECGAVLHGVAFGPQSRVRKLPKSQRLPSRVNAGYLCPECVKKSIKAKVRALS